MRRLTIVPMLAMSALLTFCAPPPPSPVPLPQPPASPPPPQPKRAPVEWRDAPLTPGSWSYRSNEAAFGVNPAGPTSLRLRCDRAQRVITFQTGAIWQHTSGARLTLTTSFGERTVPAAADTDGSLTATLAASDTFLDGMAYSRGRFVVGLPDGNRLIVPAWPELARAIEDCRS